MFGRGAGPLLRFSLHIGPGEAADIGASRRPGHTIPARFWHVPLPVPIGPNLDRKPPAKTAGGFRVLTQALRLWSRDRFRAGARYARLDRRGYATAGSVSTLTSAGPPAAKARSSAGRSSAGSSDQLAVTPERLDQLVVARLGPQLGGDRVAVEELHRVLLERPDPVVADHADDRDAVARERVELDRRESERPVAEQQHDLALRVRELRGQRVARARSRDSRTGPDRASSRAGRSRPRAPRTRRSRRRRRPRSRRDRAAARARRRSASGAAARARRRARRPRRRARSVFDRAQRAQPRRRASDGLRRAASSRSASSVAGSAPYSPRADRARVVALGLGDVDRDRARTRRPNAAPNAEPEVERHADHERDVGVAQADARARARRTARGRPAGSRARAR